MPDALSPVDGTDAKGAEMARLLLHHKGEILERWQVAARSESPGAATQPEPVLLNALPHFLDELASELAQGPSGASEAGASAPLLAKEHGRQRAELSDYSLPQVVQEYQLLARVVLDVLDRATSMSAATRDRLLQKVFGAVHHAVGEYSRVREAERESSRIALEEANVSLAHRVEERTRDLVRSETAFRRLVEGVRDYAIFLLDPEGHITSWNPGAERMKGYTAAEAIGQHYSILYSADGVRRDEPGEHLRVAKRDGRFRGEGMRQRKNGECYLADVLITPIYEGESHIGFSKVVEDLSERARLLQELNLSRFFGERLRLEAEMKDRFVTLLTHDLRSPLSVAMNFASMIARAPRDPDKVFTWARGVQNAVKRTDRMISDLLDSAQVQAGEPLQLEFADCELGELARRTCEEVGAQHPNRVRLIRSGDLRGHWSCDGLHRVLDNLVSNALKYSEAESVVTVQVRRVEDRVLLSVHNLGKHISLEEQAELFLPFRRARTAEGKRGWGLGLTLVRGIVQAHGGVVKVTSYPSEGTTFTVDLPVRPEQR